MSLSETRHWVRRLRPSPEADLRLLCFHYAGGAASMFRDWPALLPPSVEPLAVQLPGRENRLREPAYDRMAPLVDALVTALRPVLVEPYAFVGISMGAKVALQLTRALRDLGAPTPRILCVASCTAPTLHAPLPWNEPDDQIVGYMRELGATPPDVLADPEMLALLVPTLRADLTVLCTYEPPVDDPIDVPIHAFAGADDPESSPARVAPWRAETAAEFRLDVLPGGHLLSEDGQRRMIRLIADDVAPTGGGHSPPHIAISCNTHRPW